MDWELITVKIICFLVIGALVALIGVAIWTSIPKLIEGVVVDKEFIAAHTSRSTTFVYSGKVTVPIARTIHHPDTWRIHVSGMTEDGEAHAEWWEIGEALYSRIEIGDWVMRDPETGVIERR